MEAESLAERILQDLDTIFQRNPFIDEFAIIPVPHSTTNKCPVVHVDHKLALESWCVPHIYLYVYTQIMKYRSNQIKAEIPMLLNWLRVALLINPDFTTAWNIRKEQVLADHLTIEQDLQFSELVLRKKPKNSDVFAHRCWLLEREANGAPLGRARVDKEIRVCEQAAQQHPSNYYAWSHRSWLLDHLQPSHLPQVLEAELTSTQQNWLQGHVSDHSGLQYRQGLLRRQGLEAGLLLGELVLVAEVLGTFPGHEALWLHRRFLLYHLLQPPAGAKKSRLDHRWVLERESLLAQAIPATYTWQKELAARHLRWIQRLLACNGK